MVWSPSKQMKLIATVLLVIGTLNACCSVCQQQQQSQEATSEPNTTPVDSLEDPSEASSATYADEQQSDDPMNNVCLRCYEKVEAAKELIASHNSLLERQKLLIQRKRKKAEEAARAANRTKNDSQRGSSNVSSQSSRSRPKSINLNQSNHTSESSLRTRSLPPAPQNTEEPKQIVISTLRVARAADNVGATTATTLNQQHQPPRTVKKDPELKRFRLALQKKLNETCQALLVVQDCVAELADECIGELQYHSHEVFANQMHGKLNCPYRNNPGLRVFPGILPKSLREIEPTPKFPSPRPISSEQEVSARIKEMFPNGLGRPLGVMLKPSASTKNLDYMIGQKQQQRPVITTKTVPTYVLDESNIYVLVGCFSAVLIAIVALASLII